MSKAIITVRHTWYGCDSGCCGHDMRITAPDTVLDAVLPKGWKGEPIREVRRFFFEHPYDREKEEFVHELIRMALDQGDKFADLVAACGGYTVESVEVTNE